jgi:hypothetical protein
MYTEERLILCPSPYLIDKEINKSRVLVAHAWSPRYSRGRNHDYRGSKPTQANSLLELILKRPITKKD